MKSSVILSRYSLLSQPWYSIFTRLFNFFAGRRSWCMHKYYTVVGKRMLTMKQKCRNHQVEPIKISQWKCTPYQTPSNVTELPWHRHSYKNSLFWFSTRRIEFFKSVFFIWICMPHEILRVIHCPRRYDPMRWKSSKRH